MNLTCSQMDVLISFYIEGDLSNSLKKQVEAHLRSCPTCQAKYEIIDSMLKDLKKTLLAKEEKCQDSKRKEEPLLTPQFGIFKTNLSAYIDNELSSEDNIKIKKFTISNSLARKELETNYNIRKLMQDSFRKCKNDSKQDFTKSVFRQLDFGDVGIYDGIHPVVKLILAFTLSVFIVTVIVLINLSH